MARLFEQDLVQYRREPGRHRFKLLALSETGTTLEAEATELERRTLRDALANTDIEGQDAWRRVMRALAEQLN